MYFLNNNHEEVPLASNFASCLQCLCVSYNIAVFSQILNYHFNVWLEKSCMKNCS